MIEGLKFEVEGDTIFVLNDKGHNLFSMIVQPGCQCCYGLKTLENSIVYRTINTDTKEIAKQVAQKLNQ